MQKTGKNKSKYIRPFTILLDLVVINSLTFFFYTDIKNKFLLILILSISWVLISWTTNFYDVYRHTRVVKLCSKIFKQFIGFLIVFAALNGITSRFSEPSKIIEYTFTCLTIVSIIKFSILFALKYFRRVFGGNYRNVIIIGNTKETKDLIALFNSRKDMGYRLLHVFDNFNNEELIKDFIQQNNVNEVYLNYSFLIEYPLANFFLFADCNLITLNYIVSNKQVLMHNPEVNYYGIIPIVPRRVIPLDKTQNKIYKRLFDIIFSFLVIVFILSWLIPLLSLMIKLESKGPVFFKQQRTGLNDETFTCYKFRSMKFNLESDKKQASRNDSRITKVGSFIRKTSIDEFPQFFNVFLGNMSIVGPRPHMVVQTKMYSKRVDRFMLRHLVKPGITGMAQTHGYRGEIENDRDIINRFKYDLFYLENWSIFLDLKIVYLTVVNVFKGEEKAY